MRTYPLLRRQLLYWSWDFFGKETYFPAIWQPSQPILEDLIAISQTHTFKLSTHTISTYIWTKLRKIGCKRIIRFCDVSITCATKGITSTKRICKTSKFIEQPTITDSFESGWKVRPGYWLHLVTGMWYMRSCSSFQSNKKTHKIRLK